jgi:diguanylate cyclase (GGDEF)-like protein
MTAQQGHLWNLLGQRAPVSEIAAQLGISEAEARLSVLEVLRDLNTAYRDVWDDATGAPLVPWSVWIDRVTGVENRSAAEQYLSWLLEASRRSGWSLSVVFADLDGLKRVNDASGHSAGDRLLWKVAQTFVRSVRRTDKVFRWGGDEFLVVFPRSDLATAHAFLSRVRQAAPDLKFSAGVAAWEPTDTVADLVDRADRAMYADKTRRVCRLRS